MTTAAAEAPKSKSIVDPKYRVKKEPDWVADLIAAGALKYKEVERKIPVEGTDKVNIIKEKRADGIDVDAMFTLAEKNSIDVAKFASQKDASGFTGRFRMTLSNMLRAAAIKRHGLYDLKGKWHEAPPEWLTAKGIEAGATPTHNKKGESTAPKKVAAPAKADKAAAPAKATEKTK